MRIALIANVPAPYRVPTFNRLARMEGIDFRVLFCAERYPGAKWDYGKIECDHVFMKENFFRKPGDDSEIIHNNPEVFGLLKKYEPDVVIGQGFNPTMLYAFFYSVLHGKKHVSMSDGTILSERDLSLVHKAVRRLVFRYSSAFIGASLQTEKLFRSYSVDKAKISLSPLCVENDLFLECHRTEKKFDLLYCGRFVSRKNPLFVVQVLRELRDSHGMEPSILFVGSGPLEEATRKLLVSLRLERFRFYGFASQSELPGLYAVSRIFLFPTLMDPWGVVVNEACASGMPVVASPHAGTSNELVIDGRNGYVCELKVELWAERIAGLLRDESLYGNFRNGSIRQVAPYTFDAAADGIMNAVRVA